MSGLDKLLHYGVKRKSGRYPWGSGQDPRQGESRFLKEYEDLKSQGHSELDIATKLGMNTTQLRNNITWARKEQRQTRSKLSKEMKDEGLSNTEIGERLGISEGSVRNYLSEGDKQVRLPKDGINEALSEGVSKTGYLDVGVGVERQLGVSRNALNGEVNRLVEQEGYSVHYVQTKRLSDPSKYTTVKVLSKDPDIGSVLKNSDKIKSLDKQSDDNGITIDNIKPPQMIDMKRIKINYAEDGGADKDGLIELRKGTDDLDLGNSKYAQVRIGAGDDLFLKGMAAYGDTTQFPDGVDIIFNTNKTKDVPSNKVLKKMKDDTDNPFGTNINKQRGALNIVNEQGDWDTWSDKMSSQFLSKQPTSLVKGRLEDTFNGIRAEFDEINSLTNPVVKKHLMDSFTDGLGAKAKHLKAKGLPKTKNHVLLPFTDIKPNEVYAPNYKDGENVVLVRHPHGGIFEIPELRVNNRGGKAKRILGNAPDAIGIHPSVAEKLSGADFDGDTALVIPNGKGQIKTSRSLKELQGWSDEMNRRYKRDHKTIKPRTKELQMGEVSNLITDMTVKGASQSEIARAVKHSMVVIDSEKHNLDYKQSAIDNGISALRKKYQSRVNPDTGKRNVGASTIISRSKKRVDIEQADKARALNRDVKRGDKIVKKGKTPSEIATQLEISESTVRDYLNGKEFNPDKYVSEQNTAVENLYSQYVKNVQGVRNRAIKVTSSYTRPKYSKEAAKTYAPEVSSLNTKLNTALLNKPRERQAQLLTNSLYYQNVTPDMAPDDKKKLASRSLARARTTVGANKTQIKITDREWEAIQNRAISTTKLEQILDNADMDIVRKLATPRVKKLSSARATRAQSMLARGKTYAEVAEALGVSTSTIRAEIEGGN